MVFHSFFYIYQRAPPIFTRTLGMTYPRMTLWTSCSMTPRNFRVFWNEKDGTVKHHQRLWKMTIFNGVKLTISMAIFNSYFDISRGYMCLSACQFGGFPRNQWWAAGSEKSGLAARSREPNPSVETQNLEKPSRKSSCFTQEMLGKYHKYYSCCGIIQYFHSIFPHKCHKYYMKKSSVVF